MKPHEFTFWVVTVPQSQGSTFEDICFKSNLCDFMLQVLGGLRAENIVMVTNVYEDARDKGLKVLEHWRVIHD